MEHSTPGISLWLKRLSRVSAWGLLASVIVLVFSGWGITQTGLIYQITFGLVDRRLADSIHRATNGPLAVFFLAHVLINIRIAVTRRRPSHLWLIDSILGIIGIGLLGITIYMEYFRLGG